MKDGFIILDKPTGMTSRRAGGIVARLFGQRKFGHIGTLDPMASGLLVIALGEATKMIPYLEEIKSGEFGVGNIKEYLFSIKWGIRTDTGDITGNIIDADDPTAQDFIGGKAANEIYPAPASGSRKPDIEELEKILADFPKEYDQMPPAFSAKKIAGVPAYKLARQGRAVELKPKRVHIYELGVRSEELGVERANTPNSSLLTPIFYARCSTGTYVRSLVQDIAQKAGRIATCSMIRRTAANGFSIKDAAPLEIVENMCNNGRADEIIRPLDFGLDGIPVVNLSNNFAPTQGMGAGPARQVAKLETEDAVLFSKGGFVSRFEMIEMRDTNIVRVYSDNIFIGMGKIEQGVLKPKRVLQSTNGD